MTDLSPDHFDQFFEAITDHRPFAWQRRLARHVVERGWPDVLDLPTASGKTACLEIAVFTLALRTSIPPDGFVPPRRIFFTVDRRLIVDQAFRRASTLAAALADPEDPVVSAVADRLRSLTGAENNPLGYARLRGGMPRRNAWTHDPTQPAIITCTVDQLGSRLLFRSYDGSPRSAPIHAGLSANDALILLDEAHCAIPFLQTLRAIRRYRAWADRPLRAPFEVVSLSATPGKTKPADPDSQSIFRLTGKERADPDLRPRLATKKPAALILARKAKVPRGGGPAEQRKARSALAEELAGRARALLESEDHAFMRLGVIVNRVATAVEVRDLLVGTFSPERDCDVVLMTGRMRPLDRDDLIKRWEPRLAADRRGPEPDRPVIVVSTQSLEVGADFDFDALVTEAASLDAIRQRFGRLDRLGRHGRAAACIVVGAYQQKNSDADPVYGSSLASTWQWMIENREAQDDAESTAVDFKGSLGVLDLGNEAFERRLDEEAPAELYAPAQAAPVLLPAHLDRWVMTSPRPEPDPDPALFLHGARDVPPNVHVLWRLDLDADAPIEQLTEAMSLCPPSTLEALPVSIGWLRGWMRQQAEPPVGESDVEGRGGSDDRGGRDDYERRVDDGQAVIIWRGRDRTVVTCDPRRVRPGDFVIIPGSKVGSFIGLLKWGHEQEPQLDLGDRAQLIARHRAVLRLHPTLIAEWPEQLLDPESRSELQDMLTRPHEAQSRDEVRALLERMAGSATEPDSIPDEYRWLPLTFSALARDPRLKVERHPLSMAHESETALEGPASLQFPFIVRGRIGGIRLAGETPAADWTPSLGEDALDEDEADRRTESGVAVPLPAHLSGVERTARAFVDLCDIGEERAGEILLAARLHDVGKSDARFQALLYGDGLTVFADQREQLAKSAEFPTSPRQYRQLAERAGLPIGFRHELLSVRLVESDDELMATVDDPELLFHLIASHHGYCRPFAPPVADEDPIELEYNLDGRELRACSATGLERLGSGVSERFWRLVNRYGWWGLAYLEVLLRCADQSRSALESRGQIDDDAAAASEIR